MRGNLETLPRSDARTIERNDKRQRWLDERKKKFEQQRRFKRRNKKKIQETCLKAAVAKKDEPEIAWTVENQTERELSTEVITYNHQTWNSEFDKDPLGGLPPARRLGRRDNRSAATRGARKASQERPTPARGWARA